MPVAQPCRDRKKNMSAFVKWWNQITQSISNRYKKHIINFRYFTSPHYSANSCCQSSKGVSISLSYASPPSPIIVCPCRSHLGICRFWMLFMKTWGVTFLFPSLLPILLHSLWSFLFVPFTNIKSMGGCPRPMDQKILSLKKLHFFKWKLKMWRKIKSNVLLDIIITF